MARRWLAGILAGAFLVAGAWGADAAKRVAMVVGNAAYQNADPLANSINDAKDVAAALKRLGFDVTLVLDASLDDLLAGLDQFAAKLPGAEAALFYYSGHGMQIDGTNFLLPVDIEVSSARSIRYGAIDVAEVVQEMEREAEVSIVVLDACRDNPFLAKLSCTSGTRSLAADRGLAPIRSSGSGTIIAYAAEPGAVASDGTGDHSPYTGALLSNIEEPNVEVGLVFRRVAGSVVEATEGRQHPELLVRLTREYYLRTEAHEPAGPSPLMRSTGEEGFGEAPPPPTSGVLAVTPVASAPEEPAPPPAEPPPPAAEKRPYPEIASRLDVSEPPYVPRETWEPKPWSDVVEAEPNGTYGTATPVELKTRVKLTIAPRGDADWFYFTAASRGELHATVDETPEEIDVVVRLYDADRNVVANWQGAPRPGGALDAVIDIPDAGTYWLEVRDGSDNGETVTPIELALDFIPNEDGYEPNGSVKDAKLIALDGSHRLNILPRGDADWFRVVVDWPGEWSVTATDVPDALDIAMRLHNADFQVVANWVTAPRPGEVTDAVFDIKTPGVYFLEVRDGNDDKRSPEAFTLETSFVRSPDLYEPNDSFGTAAEIPPTGEHVVTIFPRGDADWLSVDVADPGQLSIETTEAPENLDPAFRVFNADKTVIVNWVTAPRPGGDTVGFADLAEPGRYYIELRDGNDSDGSVSPFKLTTRFTPTPDQYEPNNSMGYATELRPGGEIAFNILPRGDADWFRVTVDDPGELAIKIDEGPENLDLHFRVFDANRKVLVNWVAPYSKGGLTEGFADLPEPGSYFIEVRDGNDDARSVKHATLATVFTPTVASLEPNNSFGAATPVPLEGETLAHILPRGDADWHAVYAPGPGRLDVTIDEVPENLNVAFRVFNADQQVVANWITAPREGGVTTGAVDLPAAGWYRLEFRDGNDDQRSPLPFRIRREFTSTVPQ